MPANEVAPEAWLIGSGRSRLWLSQEEPVLGGNGSGDGERHDAITSLLKPHGALHVEREGGIAPGLVGRAPLLAEAMAAREHGNARSSLSGAGQDAIGQSAARVGADDQIAWKQRDRLDVNFDRANALGQMRPVSRQPTSQLCRAQGPLGVDTERLGRGAVQEEQHPGEQAMARGQVDDSTAAKVAAHPPRHLPGLEELLSRQAFRLTDGARQPSEERATWEELHCAVRQAISRGTAKPSAKAERDAASLRVRKRLSRLGPG